MFSMKKKGERNRYIIKGLIVSLSRLIAIASRPEFEGNFSAKARSINIFLNI